MAKHKVSPYRVKLRQDHKTGQKVRTQDLWRLDKFHKANPGFTEYPTFIDLLEEFLEELKENGYRNSTAKRTLTTVRYERGDGDFDSGPEARTIEAELSYGRYNRVADHNDKEAFEGPDDISPEDTRQESERDRDTVAETRLHLLAHIPTSDNRSAFFVLHSYGRNSVKTRLKDALNNYIADKYDSHNVPFAMEAERRKKSFKLEMNTVAGKDLIDELKSSKIVGFEVKKRDTNVPEYMSDGTALGNDSEGNITIQYTSDSVVSDMKSKYDNFWERFGNEDYPLAELVDDDPSRANAIVETSDDQTRKINISKEEVRMEEYVKPSDIEYDDDGRVNVVSVGEVSRRHINEKLKEIEATRLDETSLLT
ncbi:hypothetical protein ACOJIV_01045 [Haloarcula sp. AONF1]